MDAYIDEKYVEIFPSKILAFSFYSNPELEGGFGIINLFVLKKVVLGKWSWKLGISC